MEIIKTGAEGEPKVVTDPFGVDRNVADGQPIVAPAPEVKKEEKPGEKKPEPAVIDDNHPVVKTLKEQIAKLEGDKSSMGGNLSEQGKAIAKLKKELDDVKGGKKPTVEPLFKDIKRVKDLPADKQAEMTDAEKTLFDQLADTHEAMNKMVADAGKKEADAAAAAEAEGEEAVAKDEFSATVQTGALALVGIKDGAVPTAEQKAMANAIIEEFNAFSDNDKLTPKQLAERLAKAAKLVPDYKPPTEQKSPAGGAVKENGGTAASEIDKIVEQVAGQKGGGSYAL